jgi:protein SCO1/2
MSQSVLVRILAATALLLLIAVIGLLYSPWGQGLWHGQVTAQLGKDTFGGPFKLIDQNGKPRTDVDFRGRYMLVFFGYTNCPDVCPTTLQTLTDAMTALGPKAAQVTPVFITVDPARDTAKALKDYAANFTPRLVMLTGSAADIAVVAREYRVYYAKSGDGPNYGMDHTALIYLMDPDGHFVTHYTPQSTADDIAKDLGQRL